MKLEFRASKGIEVREDKKDGFIGTLEGYAAVFNSESRDFGGWREIIRPNTFARSLKDMPDVRALHAHFPHEILGRTTANTLELAEDSRGLHARIHLVDTQAGRDVLTNIRSGNLDAMSFGFVPRKHAWQNRSDKRDYDLRELLDVDLHEVSVVTWAAYEDTEIAARDYKLFQEKRSASGNTTATPLSLLRARQALETLRQP